MAAIVQVPDMASSFVIGIGSGLRGLATGLSRPATLPRFDLHLELDPGSSAARSRFAYRLDAAVREADRAVLLMGAGIACPAIAWWARLSPRQYTSRIAGALFFAPNDGEGAAKGAFVSPREKLGFPSIVVDGFVSQSDPVDTAAFADSWGSQIMAYGSGIETLPSGAKSLHWVQRAVRNWTAAIVEHDVRLAASLSGRPGDA